MTSLWTYRLFPLPKGIKEKELTRFGDIYFLTLSVMLDTIFSIFQMGKGPRDEMYVTQGHQVIR